MWPDVCEKIQRIKSLDKNLVLFGADIHRYEFNAPISQAELDRGEARLGVQLPPELRSIYLELGNGGVGPDYGLYTIDKLESFRPEEDWPGIDLVQAHCSEDCLAGVVSIMDRYYNYVSYIVCKGHQYGHVMAMEKDQIAFVESESIYKIYLAWLNKELDELGTYIKALKSTNDICEIVSEQLATHMVRPHSGLQVCASLLGIEDFSFEDARDALQWSDEVKIVNGVGNRSIIIRKDYNELFAKKIMEVAPSL